MKISSLNNINFKRKLIAKAKIGSRNENKSVKIYSFDRPDDIKYFKKALSKDEWKNNNFLTFVADSFPDSRFFKDQNIYLMFDNCNNLVCFSMVSKFDRTPKAVLNIIETAPGFSTLSQNKRKYRYAGETMLAFIATISKVLDKDLLVPYVINKSKISDFYFNLCKFSKIANGAFMDKSSLNSFVKSNQNHTGYEIRFMKHVL